jgi:hypothetical protein
MVTLQPTDDYPHPVGGESNFNESMYFQFHDPTLNVGGFLRLANRPNEGLGERTVCLYLPDGSVAFSFARPRVVTNDSFAAAGLTVDVNRPFESLSVAFDGDLNMMANPEALADPKQALSTSPIAVCRVRLDFDAVAPPYAETFDGDGESFAPNHYEQLMRVSGSVVVGKNSLRVGGHGLRDHSWGPRSWQAPWFYRWVHGSTDGLGFMGAYFGAPDGAARSGGFVWDGTDLHLCHTVQLATERDPKHLPRTVHLQLVNDERRWEFRGRAGALVPLRHRKCDDDGQWSVTRIAEAATVWTAEDGTTLNGMAEYLDQVRDGLPVGLGV